MVITGNVRLDLIVLLEQQSEINIHVHLDIIVQPEQFRHTKNSVHRDIFALKKLPLLLYVLQDTIVQQELHYGEQINVRPDITVIQELNFNIKIRVLPDITA
jgi:hypothetical protein